MTNSERVVIESIKRRNKQDFKLHDELMRTDKLKKEQIKEDELRNLQPRAAHNSSIGSVSVTKPSLKPIRSLANRGKSKSQVTFFTERIDEFPETMRKSHSKGFTSSNTRSKKTLNKGNSKERQIQVTTTKTTKTKTYTTKRQSMPSHPDYDNDSGDDSSAHIQMLEMTDAE